MQWDKANYGAENFSSTHAYKKQNLCMTYPVLKALYGVFLWRLKAKIENRELNMLQWPLVIGFLDCLVALNR